MTTDYLEALIDKAGRLAREVRQHMAAYTACTKGLPRRAVFDDEGHVIMTIPVYTPEAEECQECEAKAYAEAKRKLDSVNEQLDSLAHQKQPMVAYRAYETKHKRVGHRWEKL